MSSILRFILLSLVVMSLACSKNDDGDTPEVPTIEDTIEISYQESFEDFANPERGFYKYSETSASNYRTLSVSQMIARRGLTGGSGASYQTYNTLVFRYYVLDDFVNSDIGADFLASMQEDFDAAREAGVKVIPRFCYTISANGGNCSEGFICPPYGDASKSQVLSHISQLGAVINQNVDVILCIQMGFIGTWGENYYTDHFGDASSNDIVRKLIDQNWGDRIDVLEAMLETFDPELMIQVRYPQMKQRTIYGVNALTDVAALTSEEAFTGSNKARIGFHNDCLFASATDFGTYTDYGNSSSQATSDIGNLKGYFADDGRYVYVGGETCFDGYSPQNDCSPAGIADVDLRSLHYTYLNADYNNEVNNDWQDGGCMDEIKLHLGYRYVLKSGKYDQILSNTRNMNVEFVVENVGYTTVLKERPVQLILQDTTTQTEYVYDMTSDMREWESMTTVSETLDLGSTIAAGTYKAYLYLPDGHATISDRPEYAIRLANSEIWDESTGYNDLGYTVTIE